ncbi:hypothetical protein [Flammeovirga sp. SJP92]|uniref:hypothetical protein n=1 Tax=Flammeovirga sp. SJP92 TaxID=1775430 RepID=UPI000787D128|nr:hypothetical protein [Flammeovirga sp. SJP92]KXX72317.1 hypothetical protein AVL50_01565 [Flammeovirga sp. SJP92]
MKIQELLKFIALNILVLALFSCSHDELDDSPSTLPIQVNTFATYSIASFSKSGRVDIEMDENDKIIVRVNLNQAVTEENAVKIYNGLFDGTEQEVYLTLNPIPAGQTSSVTEVHQSDNGESIQFEDLVKANRNLRVLLNSEEPYSINVFTDLGENAFVQSGEKNYPLYDKDSSIVAETVMLPRENASQMLVAVKLIEKEDSKEYYPSIITGSAATGSLINEVIVSLPPILKFGNETTGNISFANLSDFTDPMAIDNGFMTVTEESTAGLEIGRGDVGGNELTGSYNDYVFDNEKNKSYKGTVRLQERRNGYTLIGYQMHSGDHNPSQNSSVGLYISNHIQYNEGEVTQLVEYQSKSESVFYSDVRQLKYNELLVSDYHIRMFQGTEDKGGDYYVVSNIGTAAYTGTTSETSITYFEDIIAEPLKVKLKQRVNGQTEGVIEFASSINPEERYEITIYKGTDINEEHPTALVNLLSVKSSDGNVSYRDLHSDANGNSIDYIDMVGGQNHYRVKRKIDGGTYEYIGYGIVE